MSKEIKYNINIPVQTISYAEKIANDFEWGKKTILGYIQRSYFSATQHKLAIKKLYDYYNGHINIDDYKIITEPFGKKLEGDWSDVVNYPIIKPKIDLLRGEFSKRPNYREVYVTNEDVVNQSLEEKNKVILQALEQLFINSLNEQGIDTGIESQPVQKPEEIEKEFVTSYRDKRAILGQHALEYIEQYCKLREKWQLEFFHWLVSGEVYSYRSVEHNEPYYEVVNPLDVDYDKDPDVEFVEDADWVVRRKYMTPSSIIEFFYEDLGKTEQEKKDMINKIETLGTNTTIFGQNPIIYDSNTPQQIYNRIIEVKHITWKSKVRIGICSWIDEYGQPQSMEVEETFKPMKELGQTVEWFWVNEWWEGWLAGIDTYFRIRPIPIQRGSLDNLSKCKGPYNGRMLQATNSRNISLVMLGVPYQILYNATMHRLKLAMAKMKDDMIQLDINLKPKNMSLDEWLLYGDATGLLFVDYAKEGYRGSSTHQSVLKLASTTIQSYIELLRFIKSEWEEVCGISRQREGQVSSSETVGGVERAVVQSSLITEIYFSKFDEFKEREYQALIDYSKLAWINGKKTSYVMPDSGKITYMDVDPIDYTEAEYGIFVALSGKQAEKKQKLEAQMQNFIQNGAKASTIVDIINSDSFVELKQKFIYAEQKADEMNQQMEQQKQEAAAQLQQQSLDAQNALLDKQHENNLEAIDRKGEWDLRKAELTALGMDEGDDNAAIQKAMIDAGLKQQEINLKNKEINANQFNDDKRMAHEKQMKQEDIKLKEKEMQNKLQIAKAKPKTKK
jgi:hypothetical protein